jgi:organic radical activating enzyme
MDNDEVIRIRREKMDRISSSFCGAKWYEGTIWLYGAATASCHHNPYHKIVLEKDNPSSIFNTNQKVGERMAMLNGERRSECNTCWKIEAAGGISDRIFKTEFIPIESLDNWSKDRSLIPMAVTPNNIEIAFSRACNLACSYCMPAFSSTWEADIKVNGPYGLKVDGRYNSGFGETDREQTDKILEQFWLWWPELEKSLVHLKVTGGEPLMSSEFWHLLELVNKSEHFRGEITINSNLVQPTEKIDMLIQHLAGHRATIAASIESSLSDAEYSRDGFDSELWMTNVHALLKAGIHVRMSTTINNLTVWTFTDYMKMVIDLKQQYGAEKVSMNCNFVHRPVCMQLQLIPKKYRKKLAKENRAYLKSAEILEHEKDQLSRFISYLEVNEFNPAEAGCSLEEAKEDLKIFLLQYDRRRNKDFRKQLHATLVKWIDS